MGAPRTVSAFSPIEVFAHIVEVAVCMVRAGFRVTRVDAGEVRAWVEVGRVVSARRVDLEVTLEAPRAGPASEPARLCVVSSGGEGVTRRDELAARRMLTSALDLGGLLSPDDAALGSVGGDQVRRACAQDQTDGETQRAQAAWSPPRSCLTT